MWRKREIGLLALILAVAGGIYLYDLGALREVGDEFAYSAAGVSYWKNIAKFDFNSESWQENFEHPPLAKYIYGLAEGIYLVSKDPIILEKSFSRQEGRVYLILNKDFIFPRIASVIMSLGTIAIVYILSLKLFNFRTAIASSIILSLLPHFIGHARIAGLESIQILFFTLSIALFILGLKNGKKSYCIFSAISFSLAMAVRYNSGAIFLILLPIFYLFRKENSFSKSHIKKGFALFAVMPIAIIFLIWPFLWSDTIGNIQKSLGHWTYSIKEYFLGQLVVPPLHYYFTYLVATTPAIILAFLLIGIFMIFKSKNNFYYSILIWLLVPLVLNSLIPFKQDGIRYVAAVLPPLAIIAGIGITKLSNLFSSKMFFLGLLAVSIYLASIAVSSHPYYIDYYNELVGGTAGVAEARMFEVGWWNEDYSGIEKFINENADRDAHIQLFLGPGSLYQLKLRNDIRIIPGFESGETSVDGFHSDFIVVNNYYLWYVREIGSDELKNFKLKYSVKINGVNSAAIFERV